MSSIKELVDEQIRILSERVKGEYSRIDLHRVMLESYAETVAKKMLLETDFGNQNYKDASEFISCYRDLLTRRMLIIDEEDEKRHEKNINKLEQFFEVVKT